nr:nitric oxide synthase [Desulfobacterales bacterium]MBL0699933.1 nitric oxide synthase [Desulfobacterales bacterium]
MVSGSLRLKSSYLGGGIEMAQDYGKEIAAKIGV